MTKTNYVHGTAIRNDNRGQTLVNKSLSPANYQSCRSSMTSSSQSPKQLKVEETDDK
ncbi:hypothetical protein DPMN_052935 [Dreissena polymorpha]|uniref:Uncharacterized protein n=1 Tax=Dreissena polymorpha TaxID=45954 RepID=A0A9D4CMS6_DREPO|nr:hypothetical protein DPMN_052935 [Dreissena polymorpha]